MKINEHQKAMCMRVATNVRISQRLEHIQGSFAMIANGIQMVAKTVK